MRLHLRAIEYSWQALVEWRGAIVRALRRQGYGDQS